MTADQQLPTTGRLSSRMTAAAKAKLAQQLQAVQLQPADIQQAQTIELEIGMGNGLALLERARHKPDGLFIGNEIYLNGLRRLATALAAPQAPQNVRVAAQDARALLQALPAGRINRILIPYPDPWPKARHHKRRLVQPAFLALLQPALATTGELWVISDIPDYIDWTLAHKGDLICTSQATTPPNWWVSTKYEQKALLAGRQPQYVCFKQP